MKASKSKMCSLTVKKLVLIVVGIGALLYIFKGKGGDNVTDPWDVSHDDVVWTNFSEASGHMPSTLVALSELIQRISQDQTKHKAQLYQIVVDLSWEVQHFLGTLIPSLPEKLAHLSEDDKTKIKDYVDSSLKAMKDLPETTRTISHLQESFEQKKLTEETVHSLAQLQGFIKQF